MAGNIKGIIVEIGGDTSGLQKALSKVNSATSSLSKELKEINKGLKLDPKNTELLSQKQTVLNQSIQTTEEKLKQLQNIKEEADKKMADGTKINEENYRALQREIIKTEQNLNKLNLQASKWNQTGEKLINWGKNLDKIASKIDNVGNKLTKSLTVPIAAVATAGITYDAQIEKYETAFKTFLGSAEKAGEAIKNIKDDAKKTPFDTTSLVKANQMLISTGVSAEDAREDILALGEAVVATGGGNDELTRMASNLQQIKNAGKATAMDIRQFAYAGIDVYGILADYTGKSTDEIKDMEISYNDLTKALKKASSKGGKYFGAMSNSSETLTGQVSALKSEVQDMTGDLVKSLMPVAKDIISRAREIIKQFDSLSDSQKESIVRIGLMVAAAGPLLKIGSSTISIVGGAAKGIGTLSQAIGVLKTGAESSNAAANGLAAGIKGIISPAGAATAGIIAFTVAVAAVKAKVDEEYKSLTELNQELKANNEARKSALEQIDKQRDSSLAEINNTQSLRKELSLLVDENGKVKEGYETRANFILKELNSALGTEYKMTGNVIDGYENLMSTIDDLIAKKKAQIILEANEEKYKEAIKNKDKLYKDYIKTQEELRQKLQRLKELEEERANGFIGSKKSLVENAQETQKLAEEIKNLSNNLTDEKETLGRYQTEIENYEKNSELMLQGGIENYKKIEASVATTQQQITKLANAGLNERLKAQIEANEQSKKEYALEVQYNKDAKNSIYAENVKKGQENIKLLADELVARTSTINELGEDEKNAWQTLANNSYEEYNNAISKMPESMKNQIIRLTHVASEDTSVQEATKQLAEEANKGFNNNVDGKKWGTDLSEEISGGMTNKKSKNLITDAAGVVAGWISNFLHFSLPEKGPLSDMDKSMPDMIKLMSKGIDSNRHRLVNSAQILAKDLNNVLGVNTPSINGLNSKGLNQVRNANQTIFTTPQIVFNVQELDEEKLQQCFNYVNRKFR